MKSTPNSKTTCLDDTELALSLGVGLTEAGVSGLSVGSGQKNLTLSQVLEESGHQGVAGGARGLGHGRGGGGQQNSSKDLLQWKQRDKLAIKIRMHLCLNPYIP